MRRRGPDFYLWIVLWIFILLQQGREIFNLVSGLGVNVFLSMEFYLCLLLLGCFIGLFISILLGKRTLVLVFFGGILLLECVYFVAIGQFGLLSIRNIISSDIPATHKLLFLFDGVLYPVGFVIYTITYIVTLILYFLNHRFRHTLINVLMVMGICIIVFELGGIAFDYLSYAGSGVEISFSPFDIFFDMLKVVFFGIIFITVPKDMHEHYLY